MIPTPLWKLVEDFNIVDVEGNGNGDGDTLCLVEEQRDAPYSKLNTHNFHVTPPYPMDDDSEEDIR